MTSPSAIWRPFVDLFEPHGRSGRREWLVFTGLAWLLGWAFLLLMPLGCLGAGPVGPCLPGWPGGWAFGLVLASLASWAWLARLTLGVRRLHDVGRGGVAWCFVYLWPAVRLGPPLGWAWLWDGTAPGPPVWDPLGREASVAGVAIWVIWAALWLRCWALMLRPGEAGQNRFGRPGSVTRDWERPPPKLRDPWAEK